MTRTLLFFAAAMSTLAQNSGDLVSSSVLKDVNKGVAITIMNRHSAALTALLVETRQYSSTGKLMAVHAKYHDVYVNVNHDEPLAPGASRTVWLLAPQALKVAEMDVQFIAALFQDGARVGSERGIRILAGRRAEVRRAIADARSALSRSNGSATIAASELQALYDRSVAFKGKTEVEHTIGGISTLVPIAIMRELSARNAVCSQDDCRSASLRSVTQYLEQWDSWLASTGN